MPLSKRQKFIKKVEQTLNHINKAVLYIGFILDYVPSGKWTKRVLVIRLNCRTALVLLNKALKEWSR